jgi:hypothetical protein
MTEIALASLPEAGGQGERGKDVRRALRLRLERSAESRVGEAGIELVLRHSSSVLECLP